MRFESRVLIQLKGNLALSRALGDFEFKSATNLPPEQQVVTGKKKKEYIIKNMAYIYVPYEQPTLILQSTRLQKRMNLWS